MSAKDIIEEIKVRVEKLKSFPAKRLEVLYNKFYGEFKLHPDVFKNANYYRFLENLPEMRYDNNDLDVRTDPYVIKAFKESKVQNSKIKIEELYLYPGQWFYIHSDRGAEEILVYWKFFSDEEDEVDAQSLQPSIEEDDFSETEDKYFSSESSTAETEDRLSSDNDDY